MRVKLDRHEFFYCAEVGVARKIKGQEAGRSGKYGADNNSAESWGNDVEGACAEYALAKLLNVFWSGSVGICLPSDVGPLQVRSTRLNDGSLILHDDDHDDDVFVLVVGHDGSYDMRGWCYAREGKVFKYWRDGQRGRPAYFVPQSVLRGMETLLDRVEVTV